MPRAAENVAGFTRNHNSLVIISRIFAGIGWGLAVLGLVVCVFAWGSMSIAVGEIVTEGFAADIGTVAAIAMPFLSGLMMVLSGMLIVACGQVLRVVSTIEANTQGAFLLLDRRLPNPYPDVETYPGLNDPVLGPAIPM